MFDNYIANNLIWSCLVSLIFHGRSPLLINIHTGTLPASGTDAVVFITVFGEWGDSCKRRLGHSHLERRQVSTESFSLHVCLMYLILLFSSTIFLFTYEVPALMLHSSNLWK